MRTRVAAISILLLAAVALAGCKGGGPEPRPPLRVGDPAPGFSLKDTGGNQWSLGQFRGKVAVINFWATWCPPCKEEMPSLNALVINTMDMPDVVYMTILYKDTPENATAFMADNGYVLPVLLDPDMRVAEAYGVTGVPETYVIDKKGVLRSKVIGPMDFDTPESRPYLEGLLAEP